MGVSVLAMTNGAASLFGVGSAMEGVRTAASCAAARRDVSLRLYQGADRLGKFGTWLGVPAQARQGCRALHYERNPVRAAEKNA